MLFNSSRDIGKGEAGMGRGQSWSSTKTISVAGAALTFALLAAWPQSAQAAPGDLDPTFVGNGLERFDLGIGDSVAGFSGSAAADAPGGGIVVAYDAPSGDGFDGFGLRRYTANGSLDPSFEGETVFFTGRSVFVRNVAVQPDGRIIVVGGEFGGDSPAFFVARYTTNGSLDPSFSGDGKATYSVGGESASFNGATSVARTSDGRIVVAGIASPGTWLIRLLPDGTLDTSFSSDGTVFTGISGESEAQLAIQGDDKVVVSISDFNFTVQRYNTDGTLDTGFGGDGEVQTSFGTDPATTKAVAIQPDGAILVVGQYPSSEFSTGASPDFAIARFTTAGTPDGSFSADGKLLVDFGDTVDSAELIGFQADGKIIVGGEVVAPDAGPAFYVGLVRLTGAGELDLSFSGDGRALVEFGGPESYGLVLHPEATGILVGGHVTMRYIHARGLSDYYLGEQWNTRPVPAFARLNLSGTLDAGFGSGGIARGEGFTYPDSTPDYALSSLIQADGRIVTAGSSNVASTTDDFVALRLTPDGNLDPSFSGDGRASVDFGPDSNDYARTVLASGVKLVLAGTRYRDVLAFDDMGGDFALARLNGDGTLDSAFSGDGRVTTDLGGHDLLTAAAIQSDGKIVAVGATGNGFGEVAIARYNTDGSLDTSFAGDGVQQLSVEASSIANVVAIQPSGKIVVAGTSSDGLESTSGFVTRVNANGSPDSTFAGDGVFETAAVAALTMRDDGSLVLGTDTFGALGLEDLTVDGDFGPLFFPSVTGMNNLSSLSLAFDADGRLLVAGGSGDDLKAARFLATGEHDEAYGDGGVAMIEVGEPATGTDIDRQGEAAVLTAYAGNSAWDTDIVLARLQGGDSPAPPNRTLTISVSGPGTVTGDGIHCGAGGSDCTESYLDGTEVVLNQTPLVGASFMGWGGDAECSGTQFCQVMMDSDHAVSATFQEDVPEPSPEPQPTPTPVAPPPPDGSRSSGTGIVKPNLAAAAGLVPVKGGKALLRLRCTGQATCRGVAILLARIRSAGKARHGARRATNVVLGRARFQVTAGKTKLLHIPLNQKGRALLRRAGDRGLQAQLAGRGLRSRVVRLKLEL
jgi:uncharacterized delta-60 repeat protein